MKIWYRTSDRIIVDLNYYYMFWIDNGNRILGVIEQNIYDILSTHQTREEAEDALSDIENILLDVADSYTNSNINGYNQND